MALSSTSPTGSMAMRSTGGRLRRSMSAEALGLGTTNSPDKEGDAVAAMALRKEDYENRTTEQREVVRVLNEEIAKLQEQVLEQRRRLTDKGGVFAERETDTKFLVKRTHRLRELERVRRNDDMLAGEMSELRDRIDSFRLQRLVQETVFGQLREQLVESEASMFQVLESADAELVEYEELQKQMQSLQDAAEREAGRMDAEMSATAREIALVREGKWNGEDADDGEDSNKGTLSEEEEEQLRKRLVELDSMLVTVDEDIRNLHTQSTQLQEIFKRMMRQSRAPTLDALVEIFRREEAFRFEQYSYIQRMNVEIKGLDERLQQVVVDLEKEKDDRRKRAEERFQSTIKIRTELGVLRSSTRSAETELHESAARGRDLLRLALKCYESVGGQAPRILRLWDAIGGGVRRTSVAGLPTGLDSARHVRPSNVWSSAPSSPLPTFAPTRRPPALSNAGSLSGTFELAEAHLATDESVDSAPTVTLESALDLLASLEGKFSELLGIFVNLLQHTKFKPRVINALRRRILARDALHASPTSSSAPLSIHAGKPVARADPSPIRLSSWTKRPPLRADELVGEIERAVSLFFQGPRVEAPPRVRGKGTVGPNVMEKLPSLPRSSAAPTPKGTPPVGTRSGRATAVGASVTLSDVFDEEDEEEELMGSRPLRREEIIHLARRSQAGGTPTAAEGGGGGLSSRQRSRTGSASHGRRSIALAGAASLVPDESARRRMGR